MRSAVRLAAQVAADRTVAGDHDARAGDLGSGRQQHVDTLLLHQPADEQHPARFGLALTDLAAEAREIDAHRDGLGDAPQRRQFGTDRVTDRHCRGGAPHYGPLQPQCRPRTQHVGIGAVCRHDVGRARQQSQHERDEPRRHDPVCVHDVGPLAPHSP